MASAYNISSPQFRMESIVGSAIILASYTCLVLPLSFYVLYLGFLQWKSKRTDSSWSIGHSDFSAYNLAFMEFLGFAGFAMDLHVKITDETGHLWTVAFLVNKVPWYGQLLFPIFTCVEHYLAVVRPMIYLNLKRTKSITIRNVSTGVVWLCCISGICSVYFLMHSNAALLAMVAFQMMISLVAMVFCCVSVLQVLIQPKPGDLSKSKFDQSKKRAVCAIVAIMSTLFLRFVVNILICGLCIFNDLYCGFAEFWLYFLNISGSMVLFVLFLQRVGKLPN